MVLPPSVLMEVARVRREDVFKKIVHVLVTGRRVRLPTEAELESREVVEEVRRLRPDWLLTIPNVARVASLHNFWTKRVYRMASEDPGELQRRYRSLPDPERQIVAIQRQGREGLLAAGGDWSALDAWVWPDPAAPATLKEGWPEGRRVQAWRAEARELFWHQLTVVPGRELLTGEDATYAEWVGCWVDLRRLGRSKEEFTRFWFEDVEVDRVPRRWVRWATDMAQLQAKVSGGNPRDNQHSAYIVDCDVFVTADRRFADVLDLVKRAAPFRIASPALLKTGEGVIRQLERAVRSAVGGVGRVTTPRTANSALGLVDTASRVRRQPKRRSRSGRQGRRS